MSDIGHRTKEEAQEAAKAVGLVCFLPRENELLLDLDDNPVNTQVLKSLENNGFEIKGTLETTSKNNRTHFYIRLGQRVSNLERLCLQACLGSDPIKEFLGYMRVRVKSEAPVCLFETPKMAKKVNEWRKSFSKGKLEQRTTKVMQKFIEEDELY